MYIVTDLVGLYSSIISILDKFRTYLTLLNIIHCHQ